MKLNDNQKQAIEAINGPLLVLAGAGTGKTRVVISRIINMIENGIPNRSILGLTFTNKSAEEMKNRIKEECDYGVDISTFHSFGHKLLREFIRHLDNGYNNDFIVYDEEDVLKVIKKIVGTKDKRDYRDFRKKISLMKNGVIDHKFNENDFRNYDIYKSMMLENNAIDFDDLIFMNVDLLENNSTVREVCQNRWPFIIVDEYQDTNLTQFKLLKLLSNKDKNICVVGDPDQSIYSWRGANYQNIMSFKNHFENTKIITLDKNYRSTNKILSYANQLIKNNSDRIEKKLISDLEEGEDPKIYNFSRDLDEAKFVAENINELIYEGADLNDIAIFYRTNAQSRIFEDTLNSLDIPYKVIGGTSFYSRREIKDIISILRLLFSVDMVAFERAASILRCGLVLQT